MEEKIIIKSSSGNQLNAILYLYSSKKSPVILILCHGFTGDKYERGRFPELAKACNNQGYDALLFDFSGSGENERVPITLSKQIQDLESVYNWVKTNNYEKIAVLGLSFGGLTLLAAELPSIITKIFWAPFLFLNTTEDQSDWFKDLDKGPKKIPTSGAGGPIIIDISFMTEFAKLRVKSYLRKLTIPILMIQGTSDQAVPYEFTRKAFSMIPQNDVNKLIGVQGAPHDFDDDHLREFIHHTIRWLNEYL